jgi:hypothetical protein
MTCQIGTCDAAGDSPAGANITVYEVVTFYLEVTIYWLTGTARLLALSTLSGTPVGILLDRLDECPDEVEGCDPQLLSQMVAYLRSKYPNGVWQMTRQQFKEYECQELLLELLQKYYAAEYDRLHYLPTTEDDPLRQGRERELVELKKEVADYRTRIEALRTAE